MSKQKHLEFCWNELVSKDVPASKDFYTKLLHWTAHKMECGGTDYIVFKSGDKEVAGLMSHDCTDCKCDKKSHWVAYVCVDDVDKVAEKAKKLGGKILFQPTDIPSVGRIAVISDPCDGVIGLYSGKK